MQPMPDFTGHPHAAPRLVSERGGAGTAHHGRQREGVGHAARDPQLHIVLSIERAVFAKPSKAAARVAARLSELEQAQLYSRDILQGLAFRMPHINVGLLHDVGDAYYYSRWGATGAGGFAGGGYPVGQPAAVGAALRLGGR